MCHSREANPDRVNPPAFSFGLLAKLVLLPGLAVFVFAVALTIFGWLTLAPGDVESLVESLNQEGNARWRAAVSLAGMLCEPGSEELKRDRALAGRLIEILEQELEAGGVNDGQITLRIYLCRALGEFYLPDPLPVLVRAARIERDPREADVRRSAIEAIAVLASNVGATDFRRRPELISALFEASEHTRPPVRSAAAFALGVIGGAEAEARLERLLSDGYPDVRYNAATGLARHGNAKAIDVLAEMLDPNESAGIDVENQPPAREFKRAMILTNGVRATSRLASLNPTADLSLLAKAVRQLVRADVDEAIRVKAVQVLSELEARSPGAGSSNAEPLPGGSPAAAPGP